MSYAIKLKGVYKKFRIKHQDEKTIFSSLKNTIQGKSNYKTFFPLRNINLDLKKGEILGVIGANGAGKTTLLQIIAGIISPTKGRVITKGKILPIIELGSDINPELTGKDNIFLSGAILDLRTREITKSYKKIIEFSGLGTFIDVKTKHYSSGMRLRLAFAILLLSDPDIILIDEAFGVGDLAFQRKCIKKLKNFSSLGKTIVLVSQSLDIVNDICDKTIFLDKGKAAFFGETQKAVNSYSKSISEIGNSVEWGSKEIEITSVRLLDSRKKEMRLLSQGDSLLIEINYQNNDGIKNPMFGIAMYNNNGLLVLGPNTSSQNFLFEKSLNKGTLTFILDKFVFPIGEYFISVAIFNFYGKNAYHRREKVTSFFVKKGAIKTSKDVSVNYKWVLR